MAYRTIIQQGHFTSDGTDKIIPLRSDIDWIEIYNLTNIAASTQWKAVRWHWQREMAADDALVEFHAAASQVLSMSTAATGFNGTVMRGISLIDSANLFTFTDDITAGTNATQPVYDTGDTSRLVAGAIVRVFGTAQTNVNGLDFTVDTIVADTSFRLANTLEQAPGVAAGANGTWKYIAPNVTVYNMFHPKKRVISNITQFNPAVVTTLVDHAFTTGQQVRLKVPASSGMIGLDGKLVTVTVINDSTFSIGINTTAYDAFDFLLPAAMPATHSQAIPIGHDLTVDTGFADAERNTGFLGVILGTSGTAGIASGSPGGTNTDVIKWVAGKSDRTDIE